MTETVKTLTLSKPLKALDGSDIKELNFQEMCVEDFIDYDMKDFSKVKTVVNLTAKLTGNERSILSKMSPKDYFACFTLVNDFFGLSQEISEK